MHVLLRLLFSTFFFDINYLLPSQPPLHATCLLAHTRKGVWELDQVESSVIRIKWTAVMLLHMKIHQLHIL